jgi:hypothetical protein
MVDTFDKFLWELERCMTRRQFADEFKREARGLLFALRRVESCWSSPDDDLSQAFERTPLCVHRVTLRSMP